MHPRLITVAYQHDLAAACAEAVVAHFEKQLPDLRRALIVLPHSLQQRRLRGYLLKAAKQRGYEAILPPTMTTLRNLYNEHNAMSQSQVALSEHQRKLLLATQLEEHPTVLKPIGRWELADQLLELFDEIADAHPRTLPDVLDGDSAWVPTLYRWHTHCNPTTDSAGHYRDALLNDRLTHPGEHVFACGLDELGFCEQAWCKQRYEQGGLTLIRHAGKSGRYAVPADTLNTEITGITPLPQPPEDSASDPFEELLAAAFAAFDKSDTIAQRAHDFAQRCTSSPAARRIHLFKPDSLEQHVFGIYTQIRDWLDEGLLPITVASQDRKLSRRLQAVLERDSIRVCDRSGWVLSTSSSATAIATLLPAAEQAFDRHTILALASSPHCDYGLDALDAQRAVALLERTLAEKIDWFHNFEETMERLLEYFSERDPTNQAVRSMLVAIREALRHMSPVMAQDQPFKVFFAALNEAMHTLGMDTMLQKDEVGQRVDEMLTTLKTAARKQGSRGKWSLWRRFILHGFEHENFIRKERTHLVEICNLQQLLLARPKALIIAALDTRHALPPQNSLLSEHEKQILGLRGRHWHTALGFNRFRAALSATPHLLLTCQSADDGQALAPVPWLAGLQHFHTLAYGDDLQQERRLHWRALAEMRRAAQPSPHPATRPHRPEPHLPTGVKRLSVSAIQAAIKCPYRFFAKTSLQLTPPASADDYDSARRFGLQLHRCLAALHADDDTLPGPMHKPWSEEHRDEAERLAAEIIEAAFATQLQRNYAVTERMQKALDAINRYVDWLIKNEDISRDAQFAAEIKCAKTLEDDLEIYGRADCIIRRETGNYVIDFKSGSTPSKKSMEKGEDVQLTTYALLEERVQAVFYLNMGKKEESRLGGEALAGAQEKLQERLRSFKQDAGERPLPAWGQPQDCQWCDYPGVCRRDAWQHDTTQD